MFTFILCQYQATIETKQKKETEIEVIKSNL